VRPTLAYARRPASTPRRETRAFGQRRQSAGLIRCSSLPVPPSRRATLRQRRLHVRDHRRPDSGSAIHRRRHRVRDRASSRGTARRSRPEAPQHLLHDGQARPEVWIALRGRSIREPDTVWRAYRAHVERRNALVHKGASPSREDAEVQMDMPWPRLPLRRKGAELTGRTLTNNGTRTAAERWWIQRRYVPRSLQQEP